MVPDCGHCIISRGRVQRGFESDDDGITAVKSGYPKKRSSIAEIEVPLPMHIKFPVVPDCGHCIIRRVDFREERTQMMHNYCL